jgi:hypothetical protein
MAKAERRISKNSSIPESPPTPTSPAPTSARNDLTLDKVLEQMPPHCGDDPFEVAKWVDDHIKKKSGIRLLADGIVVSPKLYSGHLKIEAEIAPNGESSLQVIVLRAFGHTEKAEAIVGRKTSGEPIMGSYDRLREPIKQWTVERKSFEANRPDAPRNRGGRPDKYPHMRIVTEALIYIAVNRAPATLDGDGGLFEKLELTLKPTEIPGRGTLYKIFNPIWKRIEDERKRIENEREKKKPRQ